MLGLGNSIITSDGIKQPFFSYYSDFTSGVDGWADGGLTEGGTISLAANQTIAGESGWLRCTYPATNQTDISGIHHSTLMASLTGEVGDYAVGRMRFYFYHDGSTDHWTGSDDVAVYFFTGSGWETYNAYTTGVPLNTAKDMNLNFGPDTDGSWPAPIEIWFTTTPNDLPQAGAVFYIKDVSIQIFRAG